MGASKLNDTNYFKKDGSVRPSRNAHTLIPRDHCKADIFAKCIRSYWNYFILNGHLNSENSQFFIAIYYLTKIRNLKLVVRMEHTHYN